MRETLGAGKQEDREEEENDPSRAGTSTLVRQGTVAPYTVQCTFGSIRSSVAKPTPTPPIENKTKYRYWYC